MFQKSSALLRDLLPSLLFIVQQMFSVLHKWRYLDPRARDRIGQSCFNYDIKTVNQNNYLHCFCATASVRCQERSCALVFVQKCRCQSLKVCYYDSILESSKDYLTDLSMFDGVPGVETRDELVRF